MLLQQDNSDKELWHEIIIRLLLKITHSRNLLIFLYVAAPPFTISVQTRIPHLHTFLTHFYSFPFIAGWWLSSFYRWFLQHGKVRIFICIIRNILFLWLGNHGTFGVLNQILQATGTKIIKHCKWDCPRKTGANGIPRYNPETKTKLCNENIQSLWPRAAQK
jgi:hypothetical protein